MSSTAIVLAAGLGVRMKSSRPKVLHAAAGRSLIDHVIFNLLEAGVDAVRIVVGHGGDEVKRHVTSNGNGGYADGVTFYTQKKQDGTADAVKSAQVDSLSGITLICNGDHPLITSDDYARALIEFKNAHCDLMVVTSLVKNPKSFGRIVRDQNGKFVEIVEEKEATEVQRKIQEVNTGLYVVKTEVLKEFLPKIKNENTKKEFYLTDMVSLCLKAGLQVIAEKFSGRVSRGVNTQWELAQATKALYLRKAKQLAEGGVVFIDPTNTYVEADVVIGEGTVIHPGTMISGTTRIGRNCLIESHCQIKNAEIHDGVEVRWGSLVDSSEIKKGALVGPYARVRPESVIGEESHIGNFVELKKAKLAKGVKANHLAYLGDVEIGEGTNVGCGTITCNYAVDRKKYKTVIGKNVFVGSDCQFIAPVTIGDNAVIGSGSTITKDVPARALAVARERQFIKENYNKE